MDLLRRMTGAPPLLWDGGVGTGLVVRGLDLQRELPEAWLRARPDEVRALHAEFARAGADVLQTNTFGLLRRCLSGDAADWQDAGDLVATAVALASEGARAAAPAERPDQADRPDRPDLAAGGPAPAALVPPIIVGSLGPTGVPDADLGRVTEAACALAARFAACGAAAVHLETSYDARELGAALRGVRQGAPGLPLIASLTLNLGNSGLETPLGTPLASMLRAMDREPPDATGLNCSQTARRMGPAVAALLRWTGGRLPILVQPQIDQTTPDCKRRTPPETDEQFVHGLLRLLEAGADAVGGCCGCRGSHLAAARRGLAGLKAGAPGAVRVTL